MDTATAQSPPSILSPAPSDHTTVGLGQRQSLRRSSTTPTAPLFQSSAHSFRPVPYQRGPSGTTTTWQREGKSLALLPPDPSRDDPNVVFFHPPFPTFPVSEKYPFGLTYNILISHPDWFLDAADFVKEDGSNPDGAVYPAELEPPRGWLPQKKEVPPRKANQRKDSDKQDGNDPDETKLRCTFCRRSYSGVNAKSMWRRHVYEKHRIAMSNRREGFYGRSRGRSSATNVQSKDFRKQMGPDIGLGLCASRVDGGLTRRYSESYIVQPWHDHDSSPFMRSSQNTAMAYSIFSHGDDSDEGDPSHPPELTRGESPSETSPTFSFSPPGTPQLEKENIAATSTPHLNAVPPMSPYNPLRTPAFRHSSPRAETQALRFPTSTLPFYQRARETCMSTLVHQGARSIGDLILNSPYGGFLSEHPDMALASSSPLKKSDWLPSPLTTVPTVNAPPRERQDVEIFTISSALVDIPADPSDDLYASWLNLYELETDNESTLSTQPTGTHQDPFQDATNVNTTTTSGHLTRQKGFMDAFLNANNGRRRKTKRKEPHRPPLVSGRSPSPFSTTAHKHSVTPSKRRRIS